jgi:hypothetical protein
MYENLKSEVRPKWHNKTQHGADQTAKLHYDV